MTFKKHFRSARKFALKSYNTAKKANSSVMKHANLAASKYDMLKGNLADRLGDDVVNDAFGRLQNSQLGAATSQLYDRVGVMNERANTMFSRVDDTLMAVNDTFAAPRRDALADFQRS